MTAPRQAFIDAMRQVASTVTVVTTDGPEGQAGATVSAFASLSAAPPSVLVCLKAGTQHHSTSKTGCTLVVYLPGADGI